MTNPSTLGWTLPAMLLEAWGWAAEPVYPVRVSENQRYFVDQKGQPVFWLGTTQWQLFREYTLEGGPGRPWRSPDGDPPEGV